MLCYVSSQLGAMHIYILHASYCGIVYAEEVQSDYGIYRRRLYGTRTPGLWSIYNHLVVGRQRWLVEQKEENVIQRESFKVK